MNYIIIVSFSFAKQTYKPVLPQEAFDFYSQMHFLFTD